ncbi:hypothetical protein HL658_12490 [Azospirillum sp. RWY-5-1]|uniref:Uncharacterized protein n=1 Tax=Azospirillum oleiclasticum TaxID=2735135 RepID=A0ABX2T8Y0_9PROT|nr:hypothetical protein [Azospirillum oleiclasticum]NYZ13371.1 hypothetical protein [Azospirillum oleiclasticum]NYZ20532.1 hypothetical protein [Azospirillum oleiclasticum]
MACLIAPVTEPTTVGTLAANLAASHADLVQAVEHHLADVSAASRERADYGSRFKRARVDLRGGLDHNFSEIINQLATVERLMDALTWFGASPEFRDHQVILCNPTTSSAGVWLPDGHVAKNDLVLAAASGPVVRCEVWDGAGRDRINNGKDKSVLAALGLVKQDDSAKGGYALLPRSPGVEERLLLVCSDSDRLKLRFDGIRYVDLGKHGITCIVEAQPTTPLGR